MNKKNRVLNMEEMVNEITNFQKEVIGIDEEIKHLSAELEFLESKKEAILIQMRKYIDQLERENYDNESILDFISKI